MKRFFSTLVLASFISAIRGYDFDLRSFSAADSVKGLVATGLVGGLIAGKRFIDGPIFSENVSLKGKIAVVTGGNTGLGKETALKLASLGARTFLLSKSLEKGNAAKEEIIKKTGNQEVDCIQLDLGDLQSVKRAAAAISKKVDRIDILVNNAGVMAIPNRQTTMDGFEAQIGINHFGHFALTGLLLKFLQKEDGSGFLKRIVNLASEAHLFGNIQRDNLMLEKSGSYKAWEAYGNSKIANIHFTHELARRLERKGLQNIIAVCCHPGQTYKSSDFLSNSTKGLCRTELGRYMFDMEALGKIPPLLLKIVTSPLSKPSRLTHHTMLTLRHSVYVSKSPFQGAQTPIFLAASNAITRKDSGKYFDRSAPAKTSPKADDKDLEKWLWETSEKLTGVQYL